MSRIPWGMDASPTILSPAQRTREALLDAGHALAETEGLAGMSVNKITARAGVAKGTFYLHFADRDAFILALHARFYEHIDAAIAAARADAEPGEAQAWASLETYLDACLRDRAVKALLLEARSDGVLAEAAQARRAALAEAAVPELEALGVIHPQASAWLLVGMVSEIAVAEMETGRADPQARAALRAFLQGAARAD